MKRPRPLSPVATASSDTQSTPDPRPAKLPVPPAAKSENSDRQRMTVMSSQQNKGIMAKSIATGSPSTPLNLDEPIPLSPLEDELFKLLQEVASQPSVPPVTLRVAGGWVRDKILFPKRDLGKEVDIDIALDTMLGNEFATLVNAFLKERNMDVGGVGRIPKNPDQSKHLETATMRVLGVWLDLVNLRTETYSHDSRIPDIQIGTPRQDALRRDLTINALFYNVSSRSLEDFTGKGFDDIRARVIRTPLPPLTTLLDDPLRALRAVRFAARLNFSIDDDLAEACKSTSVHEALAAKVSRERVSGELHRILADKNAPHAIALLVEFGLFPVVMRMPPDSSVVKGQRLSDDFPLTALSGLINLHSISDSDGWWSTCPTPIQLVRYAALLGPVAGLRCRYGDPGKKAKEMQVAQYILRVELRLGASDTTTVSKLLDGALAFKLLVHKGHSKLDRLSVAEAMRRAGQYWRSAVRVALVMELPIVQPDDSFATVIVDDSGGRVELGEDAKVVVNTYRRFIQKVDELNMDGVWDIRPVVNGNELSKVLPKMKRGPAIGRIMKQQIDWMVENPGKGKKDVIAWIKETFSDLI